MTKKTSSRRSKPRVFLSYAQEDLPVAKRIERILTTATQDEIIVGPSPPSPAMGKSLMSEIRHEFSESDLYVLVLTPRLLESDWAQVEVGAAWALEKPTLVVVADQEPDLQVPLLAGLEVARVSIDELERPGTVEDILHRIECDKVA